MSRSNKPTEKRPERGLAFPVDAATGERSTSLAGKHVIAAALRGGQTPEGNEYAQKCENEKNWRFRYQKHFMNMVQVSATSAEVALAVANAGVDYMHSNFEFVELNDSTKVSKFSDYLANASSRGTFHTHVIQGQGDVEPKALNVPYKGKNLQGEALKAQLQRWAKYGTIEPDAAYAIGKLAEGKLSLAGQHFVLIGAGSAMGPFIKLLEHGATVICIDIPCSTSPRAADMWNRLIATARNSAGSIIVPASKPTVTDDNDLVSCCGCNLTEQTAEILNWLVSVAPGKRLTVGNYTYLDGDLHVKLSVAADGIIKYLCKARPDTAVAFLCTPTDIHVIPDAAYSAAKANLAWHPGKMLESLINILSGGKFLRKNVLPPITAKDGSSIKIVDGLSVAQGPNYALAKRLQHWRAMIEYDAGHTVSTNIAPSTATLSVVSNRSFGWAYGGMPYFKPYEIFQQETTNALMGALLVSDVTAKDSVADPRNRTNYDIKNTLTLFKHNSMHGGVWRAAYTVDSIGEVSVFIHFLGGPKLVLYVVAAIFCVLFYGVSRFVF